MPDAIRRAIRTFVQAWTGTFLTLWVGPELLDGIPDRDFLARVGIASTVSAVVAVITWLHNWSEDNTPVPAILKSPPSPGTNPVPQDAGTIR
jgi:hypothetical protein